jgi:hypothetical protein
LFLVMFPQSMLCIKSVVAGMMAQELTHDIIFHVRVFDNLGADLCSVKMIRTCTVAEIICTLLGTMKFAKSLCRSFMSKSMVLS